MVQQQRLREELRIVAREEGIPLAVMEKIFETPFIILKKNMESAERGKPETFKGIQIKGVGKFISKPQRHKYFTKHG